MRADAEVVEVAQLELLVERVEVRLALARLEVAAAAGSAAARALVIVSASLVASSSARRSIRWVEHQPDPDSEGDDGRGGSSR